MSTPVFERKTKIVRDGPRSEPVHAWRARAKDSESRIDMDRGPLRTTTDDTGGFVLTIRTDKQHAGGVPEEIRLRRALKLLLRGFGFRVVDIEAADAARADEKSPGKASDYDT